MSDYNRRMLENRRDAAVARRAKLLADIEAVTDGRKSSNAVWLGESPADAQENHLNVLRQVLHDEEQAIAVIDEDLERCGD